nr:hypothetical protein [Tanacetum cinerariifolium]
MCELACQIVQKKQEEKWIEEEQEASARYWKIPAYCDDDDDYNSAITLILSTEEPIDSLSMGDEHLDTILAIESDEVIKSSVKNLVPIPTKDHFEIVINSNDDISSSDDDSLYNENIEYVEASPHDSEVVSIEEAKIVILEDEEIEDNNLCENLLNVHLLIANIKTLKDNPTPSSELLTKSSSTSPKSFLEETRTFHNSLLEFKTFCFDLEEVSSGSTTTHSDISLPDYEAFYFDDDHIEEISSGSTTTHSDISLSKYDTFTFDPSNDQFPPTDRSDFTHEEFADELAHIISPLEYDCFYFRNLPDPGELISILNSRIHENLSFTTRVNLPVEDDHFPLLAYVIPACCDDDDDYNSAITPNEPVDSLSMGDEHLNTVSATESDEFIKSSVENLVPNPSESEGESGCDVPACFTTFSNILFDAEYEFDSSDDQSLSDEDFLEEIFWNPLFEEEIISTKIDPHHFDTESDLIASMLNHDSLIISSSSKIDSLLDEFARELTLLKSIPSGIDKTDCDLENEIRLTKRLLYDNSSPRLSKEFVFENSNAEIESLFPSLISNEDSDSHMEEIDLPFTPDDPMPSGIKDDDDDSERDILIHEELLDNYFLSLPVNESFHFDIPSFSHPPAKPQDGNI